MLIGNLKVRGQFKASVWAVIVDSQAAAEAEDARTTVIPGDVEGSSERNHDWAWGGESDVDSLVNGR